MSASSTNTESVPSSVETVNSHQISSWLAVPVIVLIVYAYVDPFIPSLSATLRLDQRQTLYVFAICLTVNLHRISSWLAVPVIVLIVYAYVDPFFSVYQRLCDEAMFYCIPNRSVPDTVRLCNLLERVLEELQMKQDRFL